MARKCQMSGKCAQTGNNVSHSQVKTKRKFNVNLQTKRIVNPATGKTMKVLVSTKALKTLKKWIAQGKQFDLRTLLDSK